MHMENRKKWAMLHTHTHLRTNTHTPQKQIAQSQDKPNQTKHGAWVAAELLTGTSHGWRVFVCPEIIILTPAVH